MPGLATVATWPADTAPTMILTMEGGPNLLKKVGTGTNRFGIPIETIHLTQRGPNGVSEMSFSIEDIGSEISVSAGQDVEFWQVNGAIVEFRGYPTQWTLRPHEGGVGRWIDVSCVGVEAWLDWALIPNDITIAAGMDEGTAVQSLVYQSTGIPGLNTVAGSMASKTNPVRQGSGTGLLNAVAISAGTTLREAIRITLAQTSIQSTPAGMPIYWWATINYYLGLMTGLENPVSGISQWTVNWADLTVTDNMVSTVVPAATDLAHETDVGNVVRQVFVKGSNAANSAIVSDGTGLPGRVGYISDSGLTSYAAAYGAGVAFLSNYTTGRRGTFHLAAFKPAAEYRPGSALIITDSNTGATGSTHIFEISKTYSRGGAASVAVEDWDVTYDGLGPSLARLIKRNGSQGVRG